MIKRILIILTLSLAPLLGSDATGTWSGTLNSDQGDVVAVT